MIRGYVSAGTAALVATVAGVGGTLPIVLAAAQAVGATPAETSSWVSGLGIATALSALVLSLLAIPLSFVNPRAGRSVNLVLAILIYMTYSNLLSIVQAQVAQSRMHFVTALAVHALMLAILAALFYRRLMVVPFRRLFARGSP